MVFVKLEKIPNNKMVKKVKKKEGKLPDKLLPIPCADKKGWVENWYKGRNWLNFPHSWRMILSGPPNSGKSTTIKNVILRSDPPYDEVVVSHYGAGETKEWDDIDATMIDYIPDPKSIPCDGKKLLIFDDWSLTDLSKKDIYNINRLFGYASSHKSLSIAITAQDSFNIPTCARRMANIFVLYRQPDLNALALMARRTGIKTDEFLEIFRTHVRDVHDAVWVDITTGSPCRYRVNGYTSISDEENNLKI